MGNALNNTAEPSKKPKKRKQGRPTWKDPNIKYERVFADLPSDLKDQLKIALVTTFKEVYSTQDELINAAISEFLERHT